MRIIKYKNYFNSVRLVTISVFVLIGVLSNQAYSQSLGFYKGSDCIITSSGDVSIGCTATDNIFVQYEKFRKGFDLPAGWTLKVQANGDFTNGSAIIPAQYISIGFNGSDGAGPSGVSGTGNKALSTTMPSSLITTSAPLQSPPTTYFVHRLNMVVAGGSHLSVGTGTFSTTLTLTLVAQNGTIIATNDRVSVSFKVDYSSTCSGATLNSYYSNQPTFSDYASLMNGRTVTDAVSLQYQPNEANCTGWSLKVRANGNFTSGSNSVLPQYFSLRFNRVASGSPTAAQIGVTNNAIALAYSDVPLIDQSDAPFVKYGGTEHKYDLIIAGGNHLLVPNGIYSASLTFTLYNQNNQIVSTRIQDVTFQVNSSSNSYTMVLQNSADVIDMVFNTIANYQDGVSVSKLRGLKVTGYNPYQVLIKTSGSNLENSTAATIPVSAVNIETTKYTVTSGALINTFTRALSTADQIIISNPMANSTHQVVEYSLRYYTAPSDPRLLGKSGIFNTRVLFVAIPL